MRLFVAIGADTLSFDPKLAFKKVKVNLLKKEIEHRWVPIENYHVTLCFLGDTPEDKVPEIQNCLSEMALNHSSFELRIDGMGAFPEERHGRVVWVGVQNSIQLRKLQNDCEQELKNLSFEFDERTYHPHLTVARLRNPRNMTDILSPLKNKEFGNLAVKRITLFESKSHGSFPVYVPLFQFNLKESQI